MQEHEMMFPVVIDCCPFAHKNIRLETFIPLVVSHYTHGNIWARLVDSMPDAYGFYSSIRYFKIVIDGWPP